MRMVCDIYSLSRRGPFAYLHLIDTTDTTVWSKNDIVPENYLWRESLLAIFPLIDSYEFDIVSQCNILTQLDVLASDKSHG